MMSARGYNQCIRILVLALCVSSVPSGHTGDARAGASFYIKTYGLVDTSSTPFAARADRIFSRLRRVAENPLHVSPVLKIVNSDGSPWAIALPDGYIILSRAALDICYNSVSLEIGDARLAFVLGHELAHLTAEDFWHHDIYLSLSGQRDNKSLQKIRNAVLELTKKSGNANTSWQEIIKQKELHADEKGFQYAALAGYRTDLILSPENGGENFLTTWVEKTHSVQDMLHFNVNERSAFLQTRFKQSIAKIEYFNFGVRLAHFGRYEDAILFFEHFKRSLPAHEVLNNIGYSYLQLARKHMPAGLRYKYWLPMFLENTPQLVSRTRTVNNALPEQSRDYLHKAVEYLQKAAKAREDNEASRLNLAVTYIYLSELYKARAQIEDALAISPNSSAIKQVRAIIIYEQEKEVDMWPAAEKILKAEEKTKSPMVLFNLARLYELRGRDEQAMHYWRKLISHKPAIPHQIYIIACASTTRDKQCNQQSVDPGAAPPVTMKVKIGDSIDSAFVSDYLSPWQHRQEVIGPLPADLYLSNHKDAYLAIDYRISVAAFKTHGLSATKDLISCCGKPVTTQTLGDSQLWSYGPNWSALIYDGKVHELWVSSNAE